MKRVMDKKGVQFSTNTIAIIVVTVFALVVVLTGVAFGADSFKKIFGYAPDDLTQAIAACGTYSEQEILATDYCKYRKLSIGGQKQWVNCNHVRIEALKVLGEGKVNFEAQSCEITPAAYCETLKSQEDYDNKDFVYSLGACKEE